MPDRRQESISHRAERGSTLQVLLRLLQHRLSQPKLTKARRCIDEEIVIIESRSFGLNNNANIFKLLLVSNSSTA